MKAARTAGVLVCLLGLALTSATTQVEPSATGHSDADSVSAQEILVKKGPETEGQEPGSPGLASLLGLSLVVYGSIISFLVARVVTYENYEKVRFLGTSHNYPVLIPFILCPIVIYVVMEFWRVANTTTGEVVTTGWFLYDILALLFALLALQGFAAGIREVPINLLKALSNEVKINEAKIKVCSRIAFGCSCLALFLALAVVRFGSTFPFKEVRMVMAVDFIGAAMCLFAAYYLMREPPRYLLPLFLMTLVASALAAGYLSAVLAGVG